MVEVVRIKRDVDISESDLISPSDAARTSGRSVFTIVSMMNAGTLPWYELPGADALKGGRHQRYTSRRSVLALPKVKKR